uniref:LRRNT domain-containing protein n=1 Tax=Gouania willdenowi TaxID=441366 RepID=A0A8C5ELQ5_GOUWI
MEGLWLLTLLFTGGRASSSSSSSCPVECVCYDGVVDCSSRSLTTSSLPQTFPSATTDLRLHNNHLTSLPYGTLDHLTTLHNSEIRLDI